VVVLAGGSSTTEPPDDHAIRTALQAHIDAGATRRDAAAAVAGELGVPKRTAYALVTGMPRAGTLVREEGVTNTASPTDTSTSVSQTEGSSE
jgi:hypothetical protein